MKHNEWIEFTVKAVLYCLIFGFFILLMTSIDDNVFEGSTFVKMIIVLLVFLSPFYISKVLWEKYIEYYPYTPPKVEKSESISEGSTTPIPKVNNTYVQNDAVRFQDTFSLSQKASMLACLTFVSTAEGPSTLKDVECYIENCQFLGVPVDDPLILFMQSEENEQQLVHSLKYLSYSQRLWFVTALHHMSGTEGKVIPSKLTVAVGICNRIGISDDEYVSIIQKAHKLTEHL